MKKPMKLVLLSLLSLCCAALFSLTSLKSVTATPVFSMYGIGGSYDYGTSGTYDNSFRVTDVTVNAPYYILYNDDVVFKTGSWVSGVDTVITWTKNEIPVGLHTLNLTVYDGLGGQATEVGLLNVVQPQVTPGYMEIFFIPLFLLMAIGIIVGLKKRIHIS
jgi:hypothetical protein